MEEYFFFFFLDYCFFYLGSAMILRKSLEIPKILEDTVINVGDLGDLENTEKSVGDLGNLQIYC